MSKKVLVIYSNPDKKSFGTSLGKSYVNGLKVEKNQVKEINLYELDFDLKQNGLHQKQKELEKDLIKVQKAIKWADHITFCYPIWWYNFPAILKGLFDRVLLPGFAYKYKEGQLVPKGLLKGKTFRALVTMDAPIPYYRFIVGAPDKIMLKGNLQFCGMKYLGHHYFGSVRKSSQEKKKTWIGEAYTLGLKE